ERSRPGPLPGLRGAQGGTPQRSHKSAQLIRWSQTSEDAVGVAAAEVLDLTGPGHESLEDVVRVICPVENQILAAIPLADVLRDLVLTVPGIVPNIDTVDAALNVQPKKVLGVPVDNIHRVGR